VLWYTDDSVTVVSYDSTSYSVIVLLLQTSCTVGDPIL
jgi:hypothetical protein